MKFEESIFGVKILETITEGLYDGDVNCLREYVQNSVDAHAQNVDIHFENKGEDQLDLVIRDDGNGMDETELKQALRVGISSKTPAEVGWRGIGIWSGVPACRKIVITTKKMNEKKIMIEINCAKLTESYNTNRSAVEAMTEATGEIEEAKLEQGEYAKGHFTTIRLSSILVTQKPIFREERIRDYLSQNTPAPFDKQHFKLANKINEYLKQNGIKFPEVQIEFQGKPIFRPPEKPEIFYEDSLAFKEFRIKGETVAICWLLTTNKNSILKKPNRGVFFKKKGFTIGDEGLVEKLRKGTYEAWQYGEIHIVSSKIKENAPRNNFEANSESIQQFYDQVGDFVDELARMNRYQDDNVPSKRIKMAMKSFAKGNLNSAREYLKKIEKSMSSGRSFPADPALQPYKQALDAKSKQIKNEVAKLKAEIKEKPLEEDSLAKEKECQKIMLAILPKAVKDHINKFTVEGKLEPEMSMLDSTIELLKKRTESPSNELSELSREAYGWGEVTTGSTHKLTLTGSSTEKEDKRRNREFGVMIYALQDLFIHPEKHEKGTPSFQWFEGLTKTERTNVMTMFCLTIGLVHRMIELSQKRKP